MEKKYYTVGLCFVEWEKMQVEAESPEEALRIARERQEDGEWDGDFDDRQRQEEDDAVYGFRQIGGMTQSVCELEGTGDKRILNHFDNTRQIALIWDIDDVKDEQVRPDLTDEQAMEVLEDVERKHDGTLGVCWETLRIFADSLFPKGE